MSNNPTGDRPPRRKGPRRAASPDQQPRPPRASGDRPRGERQGGGGERQGAERQSGPRSGERAAGERQGAPRSGRLSREEIEWARDLWRHKEPPDEIAQQLGVPLTEIEALIASWEGR